MCDGELEGLFFSQSAIFLPLTQSPSPMLSSDSAIRFCSVEVECVRQRNS